MQRPQARFLDDGRRLHLQHGPIDLIVECFGAGTEVQAAYRQAIGRFDTVLDELVAELPALRRPCGAETRHFEGATARRMERATRPFSAGFITPMAAVAGSVADEVLAAMLAGRTIDKAYVNNGGDTAFHLSPGNEIVAAISDERGEDGGRRVTIDAQSRVRGLATSGWRGRSFSLGIADTVTVLATNAATADAAATLIANAVDLPGHPAIVRQKACELDPDSDLGERAVTVDVGPLDPGEVALALDRGAALAGDFAARGLIAGAALFLAGRHRFRPDALPVAAGQAEERTMRLGKREAMEPAQ